MIIDSNLKRESISPLHLQRLLGHVMCALLLQREALSPLSAVYPVTQLESKGCVRLWPSVQTEFRKVASLLPALKSRLKLP